MPTLESLHVEGFRSLRDVRCQELPEYGVIIGANGAGKSNLLLAIRLLSYLASRSLQLFVLNHGGASALLHRGAKRTPRMTLELGLRDEAGPMGYRAVLRAVADDALVIEEDAIRAGGEEWIAVTRDARESELPVRARAGGKAPQRVLSALQRCKGLHVHDTSPNSALRSLALQSDDRYLRFDGSNLAAYLLALRDDPRDTYRAAWSRIVGHVQEIAPFIKDLDPSLVGGGRVRLDWVDDLDDRYSVGQLSDGTLRAIALVTMFAQPVEALQRLVVVDEPELGLHPSALALVCDLARSVSGRCQVLLATQSPAVLPSKATEEVLVIERADGETRVHRPDAASLRDWLDNYTIPELWDMNLLGARP